ncbi:HAD-like domain-containing protein, partial [Pilaira anomala]
YLKLTLETSVTLRNKQRQSLILDLNGTLCSRSSLTTFTARPHAKKFFDYVFTNFTVMVWSSAQSYSVRNMCKMFEPYKPQIVWDRSHLGLAPADFNSNVETVKDLEKVWKKLSDFNPTNTIVLDDSASKLALQPYNLIKMSTFDYQDFMKSATGERDLLKVIKYLKTLQFQSNVANYMRFNPF